MHLKRVWRHANYVGLILVLLTFYISSRSAHCSSIFLCSGKPRSHLKQNAGLSAASIRSADTSAQYNVSSGVLRKAICLELNWFWLDIPLTTLKQAFETAGVELIIVSNVEIEQAVGRTTLPVEFLNGSNYADIRAWKYKEYALWDLALGTICRNHQVEPFDIISDLVKWTPTIQESYQRTVQEIIVAEELISLHDPCLILYVQGHVGFSAPLRALAKQENVAVLSLENSMHKDKLVWDCVTGISTQSKQAQLLFDPEHIDVVDSMGIINEYFMHIGTLKMKQHESTSLRNSHEVLPPSMSNGKKKTVLFLGQVYNDAAVVFGLREAFASQSHVLEQLVEIIDDMDANLVIRLHPKECSGIKGDDMERLTVHKLEEHTRKGYVRDIFPMFKNNTMKYTFDDCRTYVTYDLIRAADVVVTINSQAGLEAAALGKPLITVGEAFYSALEFCEVVSSPSELKVAVKQAIIENVHGKRQMLREQAVKFMYFYVYKYGMIRSANAVFDKARWTISSRCGALPQ